MGQLAASIAAAMILGGATGLAQAPAPAAVDPRVHDLIVLVESADRPAALDAATELERIGPSVAPALVETLKTQPGCQPQWVASALLARLKLEAALVESTLLQMARGTCLVSSNADLGVPQDAALAVVDRVRGIGLMTELLRSSDEFARRRAAFAIDELTKRLMPDHPQAIAATPEIVAAADAALPVLRAVARSKASVEIRCVSYGALDRARRLPIDTLRARATKLLAGVTVACGPGTDSAAAAPGPAPPVTREVRRESLEALVSRLDRQPPEQAAQASATLIAAGAEVEPLLRQRLRQTDRCRGLALAAGILANRNAAASAAADAAGADVDVEAAFTRVLEGRCDGRDPFDLRLAQGVAAAFMSRADGIGTVTALLAHRDVGVRRRAAEAFGTLFERLGAGEHGQPMAPLDATLLPAARAALEPLVTLAATERDAQARCLAVRALLHAQQAVDDGLRSAAAAATAGRTLRCLAPPMR